MFDKVDASGTNASLELIITGDNLADIQTASDTVEKALADQKGLANVKSNLGVARKQLVVDVDQAKAAKYGMNAAMVAGTVRGYVAEREGRHDQGRRPAHRRLLRHSRSTRSSRPRRCATSSWTRLWASPSSSPRSPR